jgi:poly(ADP-ribose) glycohydrolase ARH3
MFFPGGSYANGGVMRIAPVGLAFRHAQPEMLREAVRQALLPTHTHADAIDAACVQAYAIGILAKHTHGEIKPLDLLTLMESFATGSVLKQKLQQVKQALQSKSSAEELLKTICTPNLHGQAFQIHAAEALACSVWSFMTHWANPEEAIVEAVCLGGDCDTVGAITGALAGALHGSLWIPKRWLEPMENQPITGRNALIETACSLAKLDLTNVAAPK